MNEKLFSRIIIIFTLIFFLFYQPLYSRDIDLDGIYIKKDSLYYKRLLNAKLGTHEAASSLFIDNDIIHAGWINGKEIFFIQELPEVNIVFAYSLVDHTKLEIARLKGTITTALISSNGRFIFLKRLIIARYNNFKGETLFLDIKNRKLEIKKSLFFFRNISLSPEGNSILFEDKRGIVEYYPDFKIKRLICKKKEYSDIALSSNPTLAYISPNRKKILVINGSGGYYGSKLITDKINWKIRGITSATEICWLGNSKIAFRRGYTGNFSVIIFNTRTGRSRRIVSNSLNTNLNFSPVSETLAFLKNQIIYIYNHSEDRLQNIGLEGEDVSFSPDGSRFISLLQKKLFITNLNYLEKRGIELKKSYKKILYLYRVLLGRRKDWANEYSYSYIKRKIYDYSRLLGY